ncbi:MAG: gas vesicle protein [Ignavibacteriales bacterium]|nr:gas vesicle protein [Ignavibacteriales bacterium]
MGNSSTLVDVIDRILDKGVVINADISVSLVGIELLGIRIRAAVASFETAAKWGLEFPGGTNLQASGWKKIAAAPVEATAGIGLEGEKPWP